MHTYFDFDKAAQDVPEGAFMISERGLLFPFKWRLTGHKKTVLFLPGRTVREKPIPSFQRSSYARELPYNCISCFDPTLFYSPDLTLGWFQGRRNVFFAAMLGRLIKKMLTAIGMRGEDLLIYASSGGGIPGFHVASAIAGSTLYASNIQTDAAAYYPRFYDAMTRVCYPDDAPEEIDDKRRERLSVFHIDAPFNLVYTQNTADEFHYTRHFRPYVQGASLRPQINSQFLTFDAPEIGHGVLPRTGELAVIRSLCEGMDIVRQSAAAGICFDEWQNDKSVAI